MLFDYTIGLSILFSRLFVVLLGGNEWRYGAGYEEWRVELEREARNLTGSPKIGEDNSLENRKI